jgi:hypothetical protein
MDDVEPMKAADIAESESEQTATIPDSGETTPAALAWSAATEEQETDAISEKRSRALWLGPVMALLAAAIAVASVARSCCQETQRSERGSHRLRHPMIGFTAALGCLGNEHICDTHRSPCTAHYSARCDVSEVRLTTTCLVFCP